MTIPQAPPLTEQDRVPAPRRRTSVINTLFWWRWRRKERLVIAGVLGVVGLVLSAASCTAGQQLSLTREQNAVIHIATTPASLCWTGAIGGATHEGCGDADIPVHDQTGLFSSSVQKKVTGGTVWIKIVVGGKTVASNSTSAEYGMALVIADL